MQSIFSINVRCTIYLFRVLGICFDIYLFAPKYLLHDLTYSHNLTKLVEIAILTTISLLLKVR